MQRRVEYGVMDAHRAWPLPVGGHLTRWALGLVLGIAVLAAVGCGEDAEEASSAAPSVAAVAEEVADEPTPAPEPTASAQPTATPEPSATAEPMEVVVATPPMPDKIADVVFLTIDDVEFTMDIYTPQGEGPWPVVVAFHGVGSKTDASNVKVAEAAAADGMLVFAPSWLETTTFPFTHDIFDVWKNTANCALAFAQEYAADNGGDSARSVVYGFSGGVGPTLFASLAPRLDPIAGCETEAPPVPPVGVVLGDGPYFVHDENFDPAFRNDLEPMRAEVAALVDPAQWPPGLDAEFFLWIPERDTAPRQVTASSDGELGWLEQRDQDGSISADLESLGLLEDGVIGNRDSAFLLELRLQEAGFDVTLDEYPGGHDTVDKVPELVGYLRDAATR